MSTFTLDQLRETGTHLTINHELDQYSDQHRLAAVLILVYPGPDELNIILTRRTEHLSNHAGQISFPGGSVDDSDPDPVFTALREAREEIDLDDDTVEVLGILDIVLLPSGFAVAPVLAVIDNLPELKANPGEVEEIFSIPLSCISDLDAYGQDAIERDGQRREFYYLHFGDYYIWGATARMLRELAKLLQPQA